LPKKAEVVGSLFCSFGKLHGGHYDTKVAVFTYIIIESEENAIEDQETIDDKASK
jgi:hypothetical protein